MAGRLLSAALDILEVVGWTMALVGLFCLCCWLADKAGAALRRR